MRKKPCSVPEVVSNPSPCFLQFIFNIRYMLGNYMEFGFFRTITCHHIRNEGLFLTMEVGDDLASCLVYPLKFDEIPV